MSEDTIAPAEIKLEPPRIYNVMSNAVLAAGSPAAGLLFLRIAYWTPRAVIAKDGKKWVVKTLHEWAGEAGLSFKQVTDALPMLVKNGLIEKVPGKFQGKRAAFVRMTDAGRKLIEAKEPDKAKAGTVVAFPISKPSVDTPCFPSTMEEFKQMFSDV